MQTKIADSKTMKLLDGNAIDSGIPSVLLMERAAFEVLGCAENILGTLFEKNIAVFCGAGNNGGDGIAFTLFAMLRGAHVRCLLTREPETLRGDPAVFLKRYVQAGGTPVLFDPDCEEITRFTQSADMIVDAIYGTGFHGALEGRERRAAQVINRSDAFVLSVDIPSGTETDTGRLSDDCVAADYTATFTCLKPAHCIQPSKSICGTVTVHDIGIPGSILQDVLYNTERNSIGLADHSYVSALLPVRKADTHKGNYGKVLIVGGCVGYTGAPFMAASAAFRTGAGLVYMAVPDCIYQIEAVKCNEIICMPFASHGGGFAHEALKGLLDLAEKCDVCVIGPGFGRSGESDLLVHGLLERIACPVVLDADGINALSGNIHVLSERAVQKRETVITPHDVEFVRMSGDPSLGRIGSALELSRRCGAVTLLKGNTTVTASPDGNAAVNTSGNPGMAKGGSGDVLAGIVAALIGQGIAAADAAAAGAYIHGAAGDLAAGKIGSYGMLPTDLLSEIPTILKNGGTV